MYIPALCCEGAVALCCLLGTGSRQRMAIRKVGHHDHNFRVTDAFRSMLGDSIQHCLACVFNRTPSTRTEIINHVYGYVLLCVSGWGTWCCCATCRRPWGASRRRRRPSCSSPKIRGSPSSEHDAIVVKKHMGRRWVEGEVHLIKGPLGREQEEGETRSSNVGEQVPEAIRRGPSIGASLRRCVHAGWVCDDDPI